MELATLAFSSLAVYLHAMRYDEAIVHIATHPDVVAGRQKGATRLVTEAVGDIMDVARSSVWMFDSTNESLRCMDIYDHAAHSHGTLKPLSAARYPGYYGALKTSRTIAANDAHSDTRTKELKDDYLAPLGIGAMLDSAIRRGGQVVGVLCLEHVGGPRVWTPEEINFAGSAADQVAIAFDNADLRAAMESLSASKKKLSTILANASSLFITVDGKGCISYASRALGPTRPGDAIGTDAASWQAAENRSEFHAALDAVLLGRASATVESAGWGDDTRWYSNHIVAMPTNEHDAAALIIADEITGAKRIERTLVMTAQEVLGLSGSELFQALAKRLALSVNADIVFLDELEASKTRGRNLAAWIDGQAGEYPDYELAGTPGEAVLRIGLCCYSSDLRQAFPNARMLIGLGIDAYVGVPLWDEKREVIGLMAAGFRQPLKDPQLVESTLTCFSAGISAALSRQRTAHALRASESRRLEGERRSQQEIERLLAESNAANRLKDELLRNLTHEIRTPLAAIIGWSTIAADAPQHDHVIREALDKIQQNAEAELALVDDVIDLSLIFAGGLTVRREATDLSLILPSTINGLRAKAAELHVTLVTDLPNTPVELQGDPARMHQVVERILANAIEFSKPNGQVYIGLKATPDQARITIRDDGEGIAPEFMPHLFSGLRQENAGLNRTHRGLGVSLAIVRAIVTAHGGEITAYSGGKGFGATFVVSLPLKPTSLKAAAQKLTPRH